MQEFVSSGAISQVASGTRRLPEEEGPDGALSRLIISTQNYRSPLGSSFALLNLTHRALFQNRPPSLPVNVSLRG